MPDRYEDITDINSSDKLQSYLKTQPVETSKLIALRCATRVMPLTATDQSRSRAERKLLNLSSFAIILFSKLSFIYPEKRKIFEKFVSTNAYISISGFVKESQSSNSYDAISALAYTVDSESYSDQSSCFIEAANTVFTSMSAAGYDWRIIQDDLKKIRDHSFLEFQHIPIWPEEFSAINIGDWEENWQKTLEDFGPNWGIVSYLYRALRDGQPPFWWHGDKLGEIAQSIAQEADEFWTHDPDAVVSKLSKMLTHNPELLDERINRAREKLVQVVADFSFRENEAGAIDAVAFSAVAIDGSFAKTTLAEGKEKARDFALRIERANVQGRVKRSVERIIAALPEQLTDLNPALLRSRSRSLEADALAYGAAGAEAELFPDAVSELLDLVGTLKDLQGCFPAIAEVERNIVTTEIAGRENDVEQALSEISASARELSARYPALVTNAAAYAVQALDDDVFDATNFKAKRDLLAGSARIKHNFLSAVYSKVLTPIGCEALRVSKLHYNAVIDGSVAGTKKSAELAPLAALAYYVAGPLAAAAVFLPNLFKPLKDAKDVTDRLTSKIDDPQE